MTQKCQTHHHQNLSQRYWHPRHTLSQEDLYHPRNETSSLSQEDTQMLQRHEDCSKGRHTYATEPHRYAVSQKQMWIDPVRHTTSKNAALSLKLSRNSYLESVTGIQTDIHLIRKKPQMRCHRPTQTCTCLRNRHKLSERVPTQSSSDTPGNKPWSHTLETL